MRFIFSLLRFFLGLLLGLVGLVFALTLLGLVLLWVLLSMLWAWLRGRPADPAAQFARHFQRSRVRVWMRGRWHPTAGTHDESSDVVDVEAQVVDAQPTPKPPPAEEARRLNRGSSSL